MPATRILFILFILQSLAGLQAQTDSFRVALTLPVAPRYVTADNLDNTYIITTTNAIEKYSPAGVRLTRYTNNRLGTATHLDVSNPQKVLVWYGDFRTVLFLDRNGTELGELNLLSAGFPDVRMVAAAQDGNLWLYDEVAFQLRKITPDGKVLHESQPLSMFTTERLSIACIRDDGNQLYLSNPNEGLIILDAYAQSYRIRLMQGLGEFQVSGDKLLFIKESKLYLEDLKAFKTTEIPLPALAGKSYSRYWLAPRYLFVQDRNVLTVFSF